jgi:hypothetical protein
MVVVLRQVTLLRFAFAGILLWACSAYFSHIRTMKSLSNPL